MLKRQQATIACRVAHMLCCCTKLQWQRRRCCCRILGHNLLRPLIQLLCCGLQKWLHLSQGTDAVLTNEWWKQADRQVAGSTW